MSEPFWHYKRPGSYISLCGGDAEEASTYLTVDSSQVTCPACLHRLDPVARDAEMKAALAALDALPPLSAEDAERIEQENDLSAGRRYAELRQAAQAVVQAWKQFCAAGELATSYRLAKTIPVLETLLRDIAPWEEPYA